MALKAALNGDGPNFCLGVIRAGGKRGWRGIRAGVKRANKVYELPSQPTHDVRSTLYERCATNDVKTLK